MPDDAPPNQPPEDQPAPESSESTEASAETGSEATPPPAEPAPPPSPVEAAAPPPPAPDPAPAAPPPPAPAPQSDNRQLMLVLSYLFVLGLIPLLVEKDDAEVQWHAKNGLVWTAAWIAFWVVLTILGMIPVVNVLIGIIGCLLAPLVFVGALVIHILGMVKALNGERMRLPILSDYADRWQ